MVNVIIGEGKMATPVVKKLNQADIGSFFGRSVHAPCTEKEQTKKPYDRDDKRSVKIEWFTLFPWREGIHPHDAERAG